jgi:hypothetical protein
MTAPKREQLANNAFTILDGGIDASQTTLDVIDGSVFPADGNFRLTCSQEIMLCTARSTNTLTVIRGVEGTTGASHSDATNIAHLLTAGGLTRWAQDNRGLWGYASQPAVGRITDASGDVIDVSDFTWVNQGTSTAVDQNGTIYVRIPTSGGENVRILKRTASGTPWSVITAIQPWGFRENVPNCGLIARESGTGKFIMASINAESGNVFCVAVYYMNSVTSFNSAALVRTKTLLYGRYVWLKLQDTGTNIVFSASNDGVEWHQVFSASRTAFLAGGPDEYGFYVNNNASTLYEMAMRVAHWSES